MTMTLESHELDPDPDVSETPPQGGPRLCGCGCGEPLRAGAKRSYLRGHKARMDANNVGADPDPSDPGSRTSYSRRAVTARVQKEIQETVEAYLGIAATGFAMKDPICGGVALDIVPNVAEKAVPLLSRNPKIVAYLTKGNNFKEVMDFALAVLPLVQVVYAHHMAHSIKMGAEQEAVPNYDEYRA